MFLDILKAFNQVWHKDLVRKLKQNGISSNLLETLFDFFKDLKPLNEQNCLTTSSFEWAFQRKMRFHPDSSEQAQEVIFTRKLQKLN